MMESSNVSETAIEQRIRSLAAMDWAQTSPRKIRESLDCGYQTLQNYRSHDLYKATVAELREEWHEEMMRLPQTAELKKNIQKGMVLAVKVLVDVLSDNTEARKDQIAAARLMSQLDGRFLKIGEGDGDSRSRETDSIAGELVSMFKKQQQDGKPN